MKAAGLALALPGLPACRPSGTATATSAVGPAASSAETLASRVKRRETLRRLVLEHAGHGGHGPLPQRGVNAQGLARIQAAWEPGDAALCLDLLTDDDPVVRLSCTHLLARLAPDAQARVQARIDTTPPGPQRQRLSLALVDLQAVAPLPP